MSAAVRQGVRDTPTTGASPAPRWPGLSARLAALSSFAVLVAGVVGVVSGLLPAEHRRLAHLVDLLGLPVASGAAAGSVVLGTVLVLLAGGLRRRQRRAWAMAVPALAGGLVLHLLKGLDVEEATICLAGLAVLLLARDEFVADPDPDERLHPGRLLAVLTVGSLAIGLALLWANDESLIHPAGFAARLLTVLLGFVGLPGPVGFQDDRATELVRATLLGLGVTTLLLPLLMALRTSRGAVGLTAEDQQAVRRLLTARPDADSLGYFALRADKHLVLSPSGKAAVAYRVESGVALASADPLGDPEAWPGAITCFLALADSHGWTPAVLACSERAGNAWSRAGLLALEMGDEAIIDVASFSLDGRAMRGVRQAVHRTARAGYAVRVARGGELTAREWEEIRTAAAAWRDGPVERGFSMALGRLGAPGDEDCVVVTARRDGRLAAVLHFVPWGHDGLSLDLMRRAGGVDNGLNELLIVAAFDAATGLGVRRVSLNFAVFRSALEQGARLGAGPVVRAWRGLLLFASRFWQIDSLYRFNNKFGPVWEPRYLCYRRSADLPRVLLAALQAESFLPSMPRLARLPRR
ncbi:MAG: putative rane protein with lysine transferase [Frankiales bacterium]|nr:putative rane protein with lysine transferase [Frankiales bacterium]